MLKRAHDLCEPTTATFDTKKLKKENAGSWNILRGKEKERASEKDNKKRGPQIDSESVLTYSSVEQFVQTALLFFFFLVLF